MDKLKFEIGQTVYLKTDIEQRKRLVTGYKVRPNIVMYYLSFGMEESQHFEIEISDTEDIILKTS